jgi:bifunctional DNA-binding transcriptional regulator/antitoxin component of YhaV-PrlF toxin-antitoxin module
MILFMLMRPARISKGGQVSVPAEIRHRWNTSRVVLEDLGDRLVIRPTADDPIAALRGAFADPGKPSSDELRRRARSDETASEARRA